MAGRDDVRNQTNAHEIKCLSASGSWVVGIPDILGENSC